MLCLIMIFAITGIIFLFADFYINIQKRTPVVICTYNDEDNIEARLRLTMLTHPASRIIVVDIGSKDDTEKIVRTLAVDFKCISFVKRKIINNVLN